MPPSPGPLERKLQMRPDFGLKRRLLNMLLEPTNPFDATMRRSLRRSVGTLLLLMGAAVAAVLYFNW